MDTFIAFFIAISLIGGCIAGCSKKNSILVRPSRNIFTFFFHDRY